MYQRVTFQYRRNQRRRPRELDDNKSVDWGLHTRDKRATLGNSSKGR